MPLSPLSLARRREKALIIQLPEWDNWRISGEDLAWEVQKVVHKKQGDVWEATNWFSSLDAALGYAYERTLRELGMGSTIDMIREVHIACEKTKSSMLKAVRKAVS